MASQLTAVHVTMVSVQTGSLRLPTRLCKRGVRAQTHGFAPHLPDRKKVNVHQILA